MTCRNCGAEMAVRRVTRPAFDKAVRELRCPACHHRAETIEKVTRWLSPVRIK